MSLSFRMRASALVTLAVAGLAGCADTAAGPRAQVDDFASLVNAPAAAPVARPQAAIDGFRASVGNPADTAYNTFQVGPEGGVFAVGRHWISFPANSVCDMAQASYGPAEWNKPCEIASEPVTIDAKSWADSEGNPQVEFSQHLRFDPTKQVILHMSFDYREGEDAPEILWVQEKGAEGFDEGDVDPAMVTRDGNYWMVYRRVKHFSGYTVSTGFLGLRAGVEIDLGLRRYFGGALIKPTALGSGHLVATGKNLK